MLFIPGTGTLKSTTVESAFVEAMVALQLAEEAIRLVDPTILNVIAVNYFTGDQTVTLEIGNMPVVAEFTPAGIAYAGTGYFNAEPLPAFSSAGSSLSATSLFAAVTELALLLENAELAAPATDNKNIATSSIDTSSNRFSFAAVLDVQMLQTVTGSTEFAVIEYLLSTESQ